MLSIALWSFLHNRIVRIERAYRFFCCLAFTLLSPLLCSEYEPNCWSTRAKWRRCIKVPLMLYHADPDVCTLRRDSGYAKPEILLLAGYANRARVRFERTYSEWKIHLYDWNGEEREREWTNKDWTEAMLIKAVRMLPMVFLRRIVSLSFRYHGATAYPIVDQAVCE